MPSPSRRSADAAGARGRGGAARPDGGARADSRARLNDRAGPSAVRYSPLRDLRGYEVVVCVCGGIAAYKTATFVSSLVQRGCGVTVVMTRNARRFIGEVTFRALTGRQVFVSAWRGSDESDIRHLALSEQADLVVVAPATANLIGKLAGGIADDLVSALLLGADAPLLLAPAMNTRMWNHFAVQRNLAFLRDNGVWMVGPSSGWLACREVGPGRMSEPGEIEGEIASHLLDQPPKKKKHTPADKGADDDDASDGASSDAEDSSSNGASTEKRRRRHR